MAGIKNLQLVNVSTIITEIRVGTQLMKDLQVRKEGML